MYMRILYIYRESPPNRIKNIPQQRQRFYFEEMIKNELTALQNQKVISALLVISGIVYQIFFCCCMLLRQIEINRTIYNDKIYFNYTRI